MDPILNQALLKSVIAGLLASFACGFGVLPLMWKRLDPARHAGIAYAFAGGLMFSASVYNLILPALTIGSAAMDLKQVLIVSAGIMAGAAFLWKVSHHLPEPAVTLSPADAKLQRTRWLIFLSMMVHSIPEGVAVGVGFSTSGALAGEPGAVDGVEMVGRYIAVAIAIHNIPEGLAVAIPMRAAGTSLHKCFWAAVATSLPQPIAAIPACLAAWFFRPLMPGLMGFAAGAMIFLIVLDLIPEALETTKPMPIAWAFIIGFCTMLIIQAAL